MTITESLHRYFSQFRLLDFPFQVEERPEEPTVKRYTGGDTTRQQVYTLTSLCPFKDAPISREVFEDWLNAQNRRKHFPTLSKGKETLRLECLETGYLYTKADKPDRYQIKIRLTYYTGGTKE